MTTKEGFVTFNLLCYDKETLDKVMDEVKAVKADSTFVIKGDEDLNNVVILSKSKIVSVDERLP
jgi:anthranilate phosphoribosyltransferase